MKQFDMYMLGAYLSQLKRSNSLNLSGESVGVRDVLQVLEGQVLRENWLILVVARNNEAS